MKKRFIVLLFTLFFTLSAYSQIIATIAGGDSLGLGDGGSAIDCELNEPIGIALDASGNLYICDRYNYRIRKVSPAVGGVITTVAGIGYPGFSGDDSAATAAKINYPYGIAVDPIGTVYFSDVGNNRIRKISTTGIITTIAGTTTGGFSGDGGPATAAMLSGGGGLAIDNTGNIYLADYINERIRKINTSGIINTIAGGGATGLGDGGPATDAELFGPEFVTVDGMGNVYIGDTHHNRVRKVNTSGIITTIAGNGTAGYSGDDSAATAAKINQPYGIAIDGSGNLYICDALNNLIRKVNSSGIITTIAGTGIPGYNGDGELAIDAELASPVNIVLDGAANVYISDPGNNRIRYIRNTVFVNSINNINADLRIFPNPCKGHFIIDNPSTANEDAKIIITNAVGQKIKEVTTDTNKSIEVQLDVPDGIYFLSVTTHKNRVKKIIVAR